MVYCHVTRSVLHTLQVLYGKIVSDISNAGNLGAFIHQWLNDFSALGPGIPSPAMSLGVGWRDAQGHALAVRSESAVTRSTEGDVVSLLRRPKWYKLSRKLRNDYIAKFSAAEVGDRVSPDPPDGHESGEATSTSDFSVGWSAGRSAP